MQVPLVLTVIGKDKPGLVESVASIVAKHGGNWLESRMCRLGGEFAGILRITVDAEQRQKMEDAFAGLQAGGLSVAVRPSGAEPVIGPGRLIQLELVGQDRPGIVREISRALARQGINVEELSTACTSAPMSGETLFRAEAKLQLPEGVQLASLRQDMERIGGNLMVDVSIQEL